MLLYGKILVFPENVFLFLLTSLPPVRPVVLELLAAVEGVVAATVRQHNVQVAGKRMVAAVD